LPPEALRASEWERDVRPRVPEGWEEPARSVKALRRVRAIRHPAELVRGLLACVRCVRFCRHLGCWSVRIDRADLSEAGWRTRLGQARAWVAWLLSETLKGEACRTLWLLCTGLRRVLPVDGTPRTCLGKDGTTWRVHTAFDVRAGRRTEAHRTDRPVGDTWTRFTIQAGDLVVSDAITGSPERIGWVNEHHADAVVRCSAHTAPLFARNGQRLDVIRWLTGCRAPAGRIGETQVCVHQTHGTPVTEAQRARPRLTPWISQAG
jgi:hypothetical protein